MTTPVQDKAQRLRRMLGGERPVLVAGAHDGLSARIAERAGFDAIWASGFGIAAVRALPDANILTMSETLAAAKEMDEACGLPVIADCDNGFGNAINVLRTAEQYAKAGIAGICIEDNVFPKRCSFYAGVRRELVPVEEHAQKVRAAKAAVPNSDFVVIARTEALIAGWGLEEALTRARAYADAGADAILIHSKAKGFDELREFCRQWDRPIPLVAVPTTYASTPLAELAANKFRMVIFANQALRAAIRAMREVLGVIREAGCAAAADDQIVRLEEVYDLVRVDELQANEKAFLPASGGGVRAVIIAAGFDPGLLPLIAEKPKAMLEVRGRTLLDRQVAVLNACGIKDIAVVRGYKKEMINLPNLQYYDNDAYAETGELQSLWTAQAALQGRVVFLYSDILFDAALLEKLLKSPGDINLVVDRAWRDNHQGAPAARPHDLVLTDVPAAGGSFRFMPAERPARVRRIGQSLPPDEADGEFIGLAMFSEAGTAKLREMCGTLFAKPPAGRFHDQPSFARASFTDLVQELLDRGTAVECVETYKGWLEVDTFEDYQRAWSSEG